MWFYNNAELRNSLPSHNFRCFREGAECSGSVFDIINNCITIVRFVNCLKVRICVEHGNTRFDSVIFHECACQSDPAVTSDHSGNFNLSVRLNLLGNIFGFSRLNIEFSFKNVDCTERSYMRLVAVNGCNIVYACIF